MADDTGYDLEAVDGKLNGAMSVGASKTERLAKVEAGLAELAGSFATGHAKHEELIRQLQHSRIRKVGAIEMGDPPTIEINIEHIDVNSSDPDSWALDIANQWERGHEGADRLVRDLFGPRDVPAWAKKPLTAERINVATGEELDACGELLGLLRLGSHPFSGPHLETDEDYRRRVAEAFDRRNGKAQSGADARIAELERECANLKADVTVFKSARDLLATYDRKLAEALGLTVGGQSMPWMIKMAGQHRGHAVQMEEREREALRRQHTTQEQLDKFMSACADQTIQIMELRGAAVSARAKHDRELAGVGKRNLARVAAALGLDAAERSVSWDAVVQTIQARTAEHADIMRRTAIAAGWSEGDADEWDHIIEAVTETRERLFASRDVVRQIAKAVGIQGTNPDASAVLAAVGKLADLAKTIDSEGR